MRIHVFSDIHLEFGDFNPPKTDADVVVIAGDLHVGVKGIKWIQETFSDKQVVYVLGNHEYYKNNLQSTYDKLYEITKDTNIHILENDYVTIDDVKFIGCTLWTDFMLFGDKQIAMNIAQNIMNDYKLISIDSDYRKLKPEDTLFRFNESLDFLKQELVIDMAFRKKGKTVIVTHNAPSIKSVPDVYKKDILSAAFASNLDKLIVDTSPNLWIHGHTHDSFDYMIDKTRVICNPRGYIYHAINKNFMDNLVVEV